MVNWLMEALLDFFFPIKTKNTNSNYYTYFTLGFPLRKKNSDLSFSKMALEITYTFFLGEERTVES